MRTNKWSRVVLAGVLAAAVSACGGQAKKSETGDLSIKFAAEQAQSLPGVVFVKITGTPLYGTWPETIVQAGANGAAWQLVLASIPAGSYVVQGFGFIDAGTTIAAPYDPTDPAAIPPEYMSLAVPVTVAPGEAASTSITLQQVAAPAWSNNAPYVSALTVSSHTVTLGVGPLTVALDAILDDLDGDLFTYQWTDDVGGAFTEGGVAISGPQAIIGAAPFVVPQATWTPPAAFVGAAALTLEVVDSVGNASVVSVAVIVATPAVGSLTVDIAINRNPNNTQPLIAYTSNLAGTKTYSGGQVAPGGTTYVGAFAYDSDGDAVSFAFSSVCGTFGAAELVGTNTAGDPSGAFAEFTVSPAAAPGYCTATVTMTDGKGGSATSNLGIWVGPTTF